MTFSPAEPFAAGRFAEAGPPAHGDVPLPVAMESSGSAMQNAGPTSRRSNLAVALAVIGMLVAALILRPESQEGATALSFLGVTLPTLCWFKLTTGLPCAGCGLTRSVVLLMHGGLRASLAMHPFGIVAVGLAVLQIPPRLTKAAGSEARWIRRFDRIWLACAAATGLLMLIWWAYRIGLASLLTLWRG